MVLPRRARWFVTTVALLGYGGSVAIIGSSAFPTSRGYALTCALTFVLARARVRLGEASGSAFSALLVGVFFALFSFGLPGTLALNAVAVWLFSFDLGPRHGRRVRTFFNVAEALLAVIAAGVAARLAAEWLDDTTHVVRVLASIGAYHVINTALIAAAVSLSRGEPFPRRWWEAYLTSFAPTFSFAGSGAAAALVSAYQRGSLLAVPLIALPALLSFRAFKKEITAKLETGKSLDAARAAAGTDLLTGLPNRRAFLERCREELDRAQRESQPVVLLMIDLDGFKGLNDTHGHLAGDAALQAVAECLRTSVRPYDFPARLAGDEFVVLLPQCGPDVVEARRADLQGRLCRLDVRLPGGTWRVGASIGAAMFPSDAEDPDGLLAAADAAMYADKQRRKRAA